MSLYEHLDYRPAVIELLDRENLGPSRRTRSWFAQKIGMQPSYLTHVLKGRAEFSADQLFALCEQLRCREEETRYLGLLLEYGRSQVPARKALLKKEIDQIRAKSLKTEQHLQANVVDKLDGAAVEYYLDPFCQLVHVFLNFDEYAADPRRLCGPLAISESHLTEVLAKLRATGCIEPEGKGWKVVLKNRHLPKESPLCQPHQFLMRYKSIDQMQRLRPEDRVSFSVSFSSTPEDKEAIHRAFLEFVKTAQGIVKSSQREQVYQINFDLFPWSVG